MRGIHSVVDDLRNSVFKEVAKLAYEGGDYSRIDRLPYKIVPGSEARYRSNIFLERAIAVSYTHLDVYTRQAFLPAQSRSLPTQRALSQKP